MDRKMVSIAGVIFSLAFIAVAFLMWSNSQSILRTQFDHINSIRRTEVPFDTTLFDNRVVTKRSIENLVAELNTSALNGGLKVYQGEGDSVTEINLSSLTGVQYRTELHYNDNGGIDGITVKEIPVEWYKLRIWKEVCSMGNKITTIVSSFIILMVFILLVSFISFDMQSRRAEEAVSAFTEEIRYNGYITLGQYLSLVNKLPYNNAKIQITHIVADKNGEYSPGTLDMRFTSQIIGTAEGDPNDLIGGHNDEGAIERGTLLCETTQDNKANYNMYRMEVGDQVQVDLIVSSSNVFDTIISSIVGSHTAPMRILNSYSGIVMNEKY